MHTRAQKETRKNWNMTGQRSQAPGAGLQTNTASDSLVMIIDAVCSQRHRKL